MISHCVQSIAVNQKGRVSLGRKTRNAPQSTNKTFGIVMMVNQDQLQVLVSNDEKVSKKTRNGK